MTRLRDSLSADVRERLQIAVYDETIRFNITIVDNTTGVVQPYLPQARGVDSPTFVINKEPGNAGLFPVFEHVFDALWERGTAI